MRTLDEVIKAYEIHTNPEAGRCITDCPYHGECLHDEEMKDALHYLKEYKNTEKFYSESIERLVKVIDNYEKMVADYLSGKTCNPPLTWDELKTMEGGPVWVEHLKDGVVYKAGWCLIVQVDDSLPDMPCVGLVDTDADYRNLEVEWMVMGQWKAYRKERYEPDQKAN